MSDNSYEEYKKNLSRDQKKRSALHDGKIQLILGVCFLLYLLFILPFDPGNVNSIRGDELKAGDFYGPVKVYYFDQLHILQVKVDEKNDRVYCIAKFLDCDRNEWILSFTPGENKRLAEQLRASASLDHLEQKPAFSVSGYFRMEDLAALPSGADSFFSVYADNYGNADGSNLLSLNAAYLCDTGENYTQAALLRRGTPLVSLIAGLIGILWGGYRLIKYGKKE